MSMHLEFEPHSYYFGHAIMRPHTPNTPDSNMWQSVYYDGVKGYWIEREAFTLRNLKQQIKAYKNNYYLPLGGE